MKCSISSIALSLFVFVTIIKQHMWAFRCNNGYEISDGSFCNGLNDCGDRSDETYGCTRRSCRRGKFTCQSDRLCMDIKFRCDGINDCQDQSDEMNCAIEPTEVQPQDCQLTQGKYLCRNKLGCLDFSYTCDGRCHCTDCSDEDNTNCAKFDSESCSSCTQYCLPTPEGPQCICDSTNYESSSLCKEIQNCTEGSGCDQHCTRYKSNLQRCLCYKGYQEVPGTNGQKCQSIVWLEGILLYSTVTKIKSLTLANQMIGIVQNGVYCTALATARDYLYYASYRNNKASIYWNLISDGGVAEEIVQLDSRVTSLSIDWITNNVYFTSNGSLSVCAFNETKICTQLKCCGISYTVVVPKFGWMFYMQDTMTGEQDQFLMKSNMDGTEEDVLLADESFLYPVSMAVDIHTETLYLWENAEQKLHSSKFDGSNRQIHFFAAESFTSFSVLDEKFYFVEHHNNTVLSSDKFPYFTTFEDNTTTSIKNLYIHNKALQHSHRIENPCIDASCTGLCLIRPFWPDGLNYTCICENFSRTEHNQWCDKYQNYSHHDIESSTIIKVDTSTETYQNPPSSNDYSAETTISQENVHSTAGYDETTITPHEMATLTSDFNAISSENQEPKLPTESTETNTVKKFHSSTEPFETHITTTDSFTEPSKASTPSRSDYVLVYSTVTKIKAMHVANGESEIIQSGIDSTALTGVRDHIYYATIGENSSSIFKTSIKSGQSVEIVKMNSRITSIAVDWITNNVHFTTNTSLSVCSSEGTICTQLKCCDIDNVALAPKYRLMFYTRKLISDSEMLIMKSAMDGSDENILLDESFPQLSSLTVDESIEKLYWLEIKEQKLHSISLSGTGKQEMFMKNERNLQYRYFTALGDNFFYTVGHNGFELQFPRTSYTFYDESTNAVKFVYAYDASLQNIDTEIENPCQHITCTGLCLLRPASMHYFSSSTCFCDESIPQRGKTHWCNDGQEIPKTSRVHTSIDKLITSTPKNEQNFSMLPLQSEYFIASGIGGFILGLISASFVIAVCFLFQNYYHKIKSKKDYLFDENEMNHRTSSL